MVESTTSADRSSLGPVLPALARLTSPPSDALLGAEIESRTVPGDVVIELNGRGGWVTRAAIDRLRRGVDLESTALTACLVELVLRPPDLRHLDAALNALATQPRGAIGLRESIRTSFASRCVACGSPVQVDEFLWEPDGTAPARKSYRCGHCRDPRTDGRPIPADREDVALAASVDATAARRMLLDRFPTTGSDHPLPGHLLDLYTPRTLDAIGAIVERIEGDLRAPAIQAALRLALVHVLLPASRLNGYPGRPAQLRVQAGRVRETAARGFRERDPWLLFEEGNRAVRAFVQRLDRGPAGAHARMGPDLDALVDGSANVVIGQASSQAGQGGAAALMPRARTTGRGERRDRVRLVLTPPPVHWTPELVGFSYLATAIALGREAAGTLPLDLVFGSAPRGEWSRDAVDLRRSLEAARPVLAPDARVVVLLDHAGPAALVAGVLGGVAAGCRLLDTVLTEGRDDVSGSLEFGLGAGADPVDRGLPLVARVDPTAPFDAQSAARAVSELGVAVLQARGEPARSERLLGEVLVGLDRSGHLRQLVARPSLGGRPARDAMLPVPTFPSAVGDDHGARVPDDQASGVDASGSPARRGGNLASSWRDPGRSVREPRAVPVGNAGAEPFAGVLDESLPAGLEVDGQGGPPSLVAGEEVSPSTGRDGVANVTDPVRLALDTIVGELRRPDHPRLMEITPGRWWLRDPDDAATARPPLSDRVEWAVFSILSTADGLTESAFRGRIAQLFRGHDTPDEELVTACLDSYRTRDVAGLLRTTESLQTRAEEHGQHVGRIAEIGHRLGLRCWISRREQRRPYDGEPLSAMLSEAEHKVYLPLVTAGPQDALEAVDCIWYLRGKATFMFEIEWTAMLDEPIVRRGARIPTTDTLVRFLVVPPERTELVRHKLARSPILRDRVAQDNWHILKADHLGSFHRDASLGLDDLAPLLGLDPEIERRGAQLPLFASGA